MQMYRYVISPTGDAAADIEALTEGYTADVEMISGAQIVEIGFTSKGVTAWALVEPANQATEERSYFVCGNGVDLPEGTDGVHYRGTAKVIGGPTAHVFDITKTEAAA